MGVADNTNPQPAPDSAGGGALFSGSAPFVGRQHELDQIAEALREALTGRGRILLLSGEPGIGKTRLADEATAAAARAGVTVLWGRCWESGGAPAYWPWLDVLSNLACGLDDSTLTKTLGDGAMLLADLLPELRDRVNHSGALVGAAPPNPDEARFRLWRAVAALVRCATADKGILVVIDDLHSADRASLLLLHFLARELRSMRMLVIASYRDVEARMDAEAGELLSRIAREGMTLSLSRLGPESVGSFLRKRSGAALGANLDAVENTLFERTQGNPLFLTEMARLLDDQGAAAIAAGAVPDGVRDVIRQRLRNVPVSARPLLDLAAVAGDEPDVALLAAASGRHTSDVDLTLSEAVRTGVLAVRAGRRRFSHALVREVLYRDLDPENRRVLHGQVATALERLHQHDPVPPLAELAYHSIEGPVAGLSRAVDFAERAARRALDLVAYDEAVAILERAATALDSFGHMPLPRAHVLLALAEARIRRGESAIGKTLCREVAGTARNLGDADLLARAALAYGTVFTFAVVDPVLVDLLEEALAALPSGDSLRRAALLARLGAALQPALKTNEPVVIAREAMAMARRLGDRQTLLQTMFTGLSAMMNVSDARECQALNHEVEQLATALDDRDRLIITHARLVVDHMEQGDLPPADARIAAFEKLAEELRAPWHAWRGPLMRSMRALFHGHFALAEELAAEATRLGRAAGDPQVERCMLLHRESFLRAAERHEEMLAHDPNARRERSPLANASMWQAICSALTFSRVEDRENTRMHLDLLPNPTRTFDNVFGLFFFAEPAAFCGSLEVVQICHDLLLPAVHRDVMFGMSWMSWEGPVTRLMGLLSARLQRWDEACGYFESAIARCQKLDARPYLARTRYEYGRALMDRALPGDANKARILIEAAHALAVDLGQTGLVRLANLRLAGLNPDTHNALLTPPTSSFTMVDEGECWAITYRGATFRLKDSLGLRYLARLLAAPNQELHVMDLVGSRTVVDGNAVTAVDGGDAGELLDEEARATYRSRLDDLREELAEAESFFDTGRATRARAEIEFLAAELSRAVGLGGRTRRAGGASERARSAVQRRIKDMIARIATHSPELAAILTRSVRTGNFCEYRANV